MVLVIDTSSATATLGLVDELNGRHRWVTAPARSPELRQMMRRMAREHDITKVAVAAGPGSFTGLRVGVAFGLGLAIGLRVPVVPLGSLELQAARSSEPVTAVSDAGRGRFYHLAPGGKPALGQAVDIPTSHALVGDVGDRRSMLVAAGHRFKPERELRPLVEAAAVLLETAREVPYGSLEIEYMQSFSLPAKSEPLA